VDHLVHVTRLEEWPDLADLETEIRQAARAALRTGPFGPGAELSVTFVPDAEIRELNHRYLGRDSATDVIAFRLGDGADLLGDIYIAPGLAGRNADELGVPRRQEILRLVVHGTLHAMGHEHPEDDSREDSEMFRLQEELLRGLHGG
jgi:probable rRNA maturation factor